MRYKKGGKYLKNKKDIFPKYRKNIMYIIMIFMVIIPFISHLKVVVLQEDELNLYQSYMGYTSDLFLIYKSRIVEIFALFLILWFIGEKIFPDSVLSDSCLKDKKNKILFIFIGVYCGSVIISTLFSEHKKNAIWGSLSEGEGMFVYIAYMVIFLSVYKYFSNEQGLVVFERAMLIISYITVILSCIELFYKPLVEIGFFKAIVASSEYREYLDSVDTSGFEDKLTLTFYNPNYYGGFCCLLYPFSIIFSCVNKKTVKKILWLAAAVGIILGIFASGNTASIYIMIILTFLIIAFMCTKKKRKNLLCISGIICGSIFIALIINVLLNCKFISNINKIISNQNSYEINDSTYIINDIDMNKNTLSLIGKESCVKLVFNNNEFHLEDEKGNAINSKITSNEIILKDEKYSNLKFNIYKYDRDGILCKIEIDAGYKDTIDFCIVNNEFKGLSSFGKPINEVKRSNYFGEELYSLFTGRGYAWVNSLPLLKRSIILGYGPGNFNFYFNHDDYIGMLKTHGTVKRIIDKPHNAYIMMAVNIGCVGCIAFTTIFIIVLFRLVNLFIHIKNDCNETFIIGATAISLIGYMIYMIINDSMVVVSPVAWIIAGMGLAICEYVNKVYGKDVN